MEVPKTKPIVQFTHVFLTCSSIVNHHAFMAKYTFKKSSKVLDSLYQWQKNLCSSWKLFLFRLFVCFSMDFIWWSKHVERFLNPNFLCNVMKLACVINYKSFEINRFINSNLWTTFKRDEHIMHCDFASFDCMSHTVILKVLQYDK